MIDYKALERRFSKTKLSELATKIDKDVRRKYRASSDGKLDIDNFEILNWYYGGMNAFPNNKTRAVLHAYQRICDHYNLEPTLEDYLGNVKTKKTRQSRKTSGTKTKK